MLVMLVEFATVDRFQRAIDFPFVQGFLRSGGLPTHWVRFGVTADCRQTATDGIPLSDEDFAYLLTLLERHQASHVILSAPLESELASQLEQKLQGITTGVLMPTGRELPVGGDSGCILVQADPLSLRHFLGIGATPPAAGETLLRDGLPDFDWEAGNRAAAAAPSIPFLVASEECTYRRPLSRCERLRDIKLDCGVRDHGCSFCTRPGTIGGWPHDPLERSRELLLSLDRTHPPTSGRLGVRLLGAELVRKVDRLAEGLVSLGLRPLELLMDARADTLLKSRAALERALRALAPTRHQLHIALIGIESFVDRELDLLNKGTTWRSNLEVIQMMFELEDQFPDHFAFRHHGGLSLILYTPWTRPEDLALNLAVTRACLLRDLCGKLFTSRLRLYRQLPLFHLAQRDGLLAEGYSDPELDTARRNFYSDEVPWRFDHASLEPLSRLFLRFDVGHARTDELSRLLQDLDAKRPEASNREELAAALADAASVHPTISEPHVLLEQARTWLPGHAGRSSEATHERTFELESAVTALREGLKPVARIEGLTLDQCRAITSELEGVVPTRMQRRQLEGTRHDLFLGFDREAVEAAIEHTNAQESAADASARTAAIAEVGRLLGYPGCCADAFADLSALHRLRYSWLQLAQRLEHPGEVSPLFNPACELVEWVPCSLTCEASIRHANARLEASRAALGVAVAERTLERAKNPWLALIDRDSQQVELFPDSDPTESFSFRVGEIRGDHPLLRRVAEGDRIEVEEQHLLVLRRGRLHCALGARAWIWWYRAAVQQPFLEALRSLRFCPRREQVQPAARVDAVGDTGARLYPVEPPRPRPIESLVSFLRQALRPSGRGRSFAGYSVRSVDAPHTERARVVLRGPRGTLELLISARQHAPPNPLATVGPFSVMHTKEHPIDTAGKLAAVRGLVRALRGAAGAS